VEKAPVSPKPTPPPGGSARQGLEERLLANLDDLAALRDIDLDKLAKNQPKTTDPGDVSR
jgi:hypothetical protein